MASNARGRLQPEESTPACDEEASSHHGRRGVGSSPPACAEGG